MLTRGYGRLDNVPLVVVGPDSGYGPDRTGDEPLELAVRLPGVPIVVDADRVRGGREAIRLGANILVLDDGFQHRRLARDLDLVLVDAGDPWGGGHLPPRGRLREPLGALVRATAVVVTKVRSDWREEVDGIAQQVAGIAGDLPVLVARLTASRVRTSEGWQPIEAATGRRAFAFAGIGRPQGFVDLLEEAGVEVVATQWYRDHHRYTLADVEQIVSLAADHAAIPMTTTKDAVKLQPDAAVSVVEAEMSPVVGDWNALWGLLPGERL